MKVSRADVNWIRFLPEVGGPLMNDVEEIKQLLDYVDHVNKMISEKYTALVSEINDLWTPDEICEAKDECFEYDNEA